MKQRFAKTLLPNGIRVISESIPNVGSIAVGVWVRVGSRDESARLSGTSHFIEHMMFKRTRTRSAVQIARALESLGGSINAFTSRENTCYYVRILSTHLPQAMEILGDILNNSVFESRDLRKERQVILEEIKDSSEAPGDYVHDLFAAQMWNSHPLGQPIMGKADTVKALRRSVILDHLRKHYTSPNIVVAGTGDISHRTLVDLTRRHFGWPAADYVVPVNEPMPPGYSVRARRDHTKQTHVCLGFPSLDFSDPRRYIMSAVNAYLSSGMSARLFQKVREEAGYCYSIYSYQEFYRDSGLFCTYFGADSKYVVRATNIILKELRQLKETLLGRGEIAKIKEQLKGSLVLSQESMYNRMNRIAHLELMLGTYIEIEENCRIIDGITARQIRDIANEIFVPERLTFCCLGRTRRHELDNIRWSAL